MTSADGGGVTGAPEASAAVSLRGLSRTFHGVSAVDGLSFHVAPGELFGIVGPDGAGKTTTLRMLAGVLPPTAGDARLLGISVAHEPERVKPHIAYMAQRYGLYEDLTVRENIEFYADLYHVPRAERPARIARLWVFSRLEPFEHRLVGQLSGGMKQKASLCCALIHYPAVLLLDEPTFGLDPISRRDLWLILHEMAGGGMTIILTTSYLDEAERCDRVALLDRGRVLALGAPRDLQSGYRGPLLAVELRGDRQSRRAIEALPAVRYAVPFGEALHVTLRAASDRDGFDAALRAAGVPVEAVREIEPSLEDVFLERVAPERAVA
jgi:ABC-2 type transport system ATP-binding protein